MRKSYMDRFRGLSIAQTVAIALFLWIAVWLPAASSAESPSQAYLHFRSLIESQKYPAAFALLDDTAKAEFRAVSIAVLGMMGVPSSKLEKLLDLELFTIFMSNQTPHEYVLVSERVDGNIAVVRGMVKQGQATQPVSVKLKNVGGRWMIHSIGVAFGQ